MNRYSVDSHHVLRRFSAESQQILSRFSADSQKIPSIFSANSQQILSRFSADLSRFLADSQQILSRFLADSQQILSRFSVDVKNNQRHLWTTPDPIVQFRAVQRPQWAVKLRTKKTGSAYPQNRKKLPKVRRHDISPVSRILSLTSNVFFSLSFDFRFFYPPALTSNELCEGWNGI
jgi:hypothetical protein